MSRPTTWRRAAKYLNGLLMAAYLDAEFVDPADCILITANGGVDRNLSLAR